MQFVWPILDEVTQRAIGILLEAISTQGQQAITWLCGEVTASHINLSHQPEINVSPADLPLSQVPQMPLAVPMSPDSRGSVTEGSVKGKTQWSYQLGLKYFCRFYKNTGLCEHVAGAPPRALAGACAREEPRSLSFLRGTVNVRLGVGAGW